MKARGKPFRKVARRGAEDAEKNAKQDRERPTGVFIAYGRPGGPRGTPLQTRCPQGAARVFLVMGGTEALGIP